MTTRGRGERGWAPGGGFDRGGPWRRRGDTRDRGGRGRTRRGGSGNSVCRHFQAGHCHFGADCRYSHDLTNLNDQERSNPVREREEADPEQDRARADYNAWKRLIKSPPTRNDVWTIERLWNDALAILNGADRDWKQMLPRDLDDEGNYGREHIQTLLSMVSHTHGCREFVALAQPFLLTITHPALLNCLSIDTFVGNIYNYISGSNGTRAIPFFNRLSTNLMESQFESSEPSLPTVLEAMSTAICEILRREPRAIFHDDLPDLVDSLEQVPATIGIDNRSIIFQRIVNRIAELRAIIARANSLLNDEEPHLSGVSTTVMATTYPREIDLPGDHHDNDKMDITKIKIIPTEEEIRSDHEFLPSTDPDQPHFLANPAERHLDTHFRLLRHDVFGELKQALAGLMIALENDPTLLSSTKLTL
jgi:hypothetical protein